MTAVQKFQGPSRFTSADFLPIVLGVVLNRPELVPAGAVHQDVDRAEPFEGGRSRRLNLLEIGDVSGDRHDLRIGVGHLLDHAISFGFVDVGDNDRRAMGGELHTDGGADTRSAARHQRDLRGQKAGSITAFQHA
jgi:hypothetical protein